jgi:hypothetical protein
MPAGVNRNRVRVRVRSFVTDRALRWVSERQAREMCDEDSNGERLDLREPEAIRLSCKKAPLTDIRLLAPERGERSSPCTLTVRDVQNNAFVQAFAKQAHLPLSAKDSMRSLDRAEAKVEAWPEVHDDRAVIVCAGKTHGATLMPQEQLARL